MSIHGALQNVADNPGQLDDNVLIKPVHELVARTLFEIANNPSINERGSFARANKARKMIADRLVGRRKAGSHPATNEQVPIEFVDLTAHQITEGQDDDSSQG